MTHSVAIIYGIGEGWWHGRNFRTALSQAGYTVIDDPTSADIVVSHSGGCFFLPPHRPGQLIVLINPPYWPGKPLPVSIVQKVYRDFMDCLRQKLVGYWLLKTFWNVVYLIKDIRLTVTISRSAGKHNFHEALTDHTTILIRNDNDAWCTPRIEELPVKGKPFHFRHLPGQHDDCWHNPEPYVEVLQSLDNV